MSLRTFLGPLLSGTVKNNNPVIVSSNTPSPSFLTTGSSNSNVGGYRNTGPQDCFQFTSIVASSFTSITTGTLTGSGATIIPVNTVQGVNYPLVFPAGSYIDNIDFIVNTPFTLTGTTPVVTLALQLIGAPGTTYATAQTIATVTLSNALGQPTIGVYATGNSNSAASQSNPIVYTQTATPLAMLQNTGSSDAMFQILVTGTGTTPLITAGVCSFAFNYVLRNPDGSWYPQTPTSSIANPPVATY